MIAMKKITLVLVVLLAGFSSIFAQRFSLPATMKEKRELKDLEIEGTIYLPLSKSKLYTNAQEWISNTFGDYKKVIQLEAPAEGKLILKGLSNLEYKAIDEDYKGFSYETISYTITIDCKDNKYRYKIANLDLQHIQYSANAYREVSIHIAPSYHLDKIELAEDAIERYKNRIDEKKSTIKNSKKLEREILPYKKWIAEEEKTIKDSKSFYLEEYSIITNLALSLQKAMEANNDF